MTAPGMHGRRRSRTAGFTLIEVMAAIMLTAIVVAFAVNFFFNLTESTERATARTRALRHSVALLDRLARDLESAYLLTKPDEVDPLDHPWFFVAESPFGGNGSDRVRFISRNHRRRSNEGHASDFATITLMLRESTPGYELVRLEEPGMPYELAREFPGDEAEELMLLGEGIESFSMRFLSEDGAWQDEWDSTQLVASSALPLAVELEVALLDHGEELTEEDFESFGDLDDGEDDAGRLRRRVLLPFRPIDLAALEEGGQTDEDGECVTVAECVNGIASQPCSAFWRDACDTVYESNEPDTCIEDAENVTDGLLDWCANGGDTDTDPSDLGGEGNEQGDSVSPLDDLPLGEDDEE